MFKYLQEDLSFLLSINLLKLSIPKPSILKAEKMDWYKSLDINTRINVKDCFKLLTGVRFEELSFMFSLKERIEIMHDKLKIEGLI